MEEPVIPWSRVVSFIRQYTHDIRNGLHNLDMETALLHELLTDGEAHAGVGRIHNQLRSLATQLRSLSALFQEPQPMSASVPARALLRIWRENHAALRDAPVVEWLDELGEEEVNTDVAMVATVFRELLSNACIFSKGEKVTIIAQVNNGDVIFEMREPKKEAIEPKEWGQPFLSSRRERYGLGLWSAKRLIAAAGASMEQQYFADQGCLKTRITLAVL